MSLSIPQPSTAVFATNPAPVLWSNAEPFDGFVWLGLVLPTGYSTSYLWGAQRPLQLPVYVKIPIIAGVIDNTTAVFFTASITPPNTQYVAYYFDRTGNLIAPSAGSATPFTVSSSPIILTVPTLTIPSTGTPPVPQT